MPKRRGTGSCTGTCCGACTGTCTCGGHWRGGGHWRDRDSGTCTGTGTCWQVIRLIWGALTSAPFFLSACPLEKRAKIIANRPWKN
ncbi:MAG: hypothetical protein HY280_11445 [Nitrospinae bacterium]|nr:hypothetical protein [Nitrospinota bacterium]